MASPRKTEPIRSSTGSEHRSEATVSRTYRAAIRIGEDYVTLEETIILPLDATDEEIQKAVELGWRIYQAQRSAIEAQTASIREAQPAPQPPTVRDPDAPASERQRHYIAALQEDLSWTNEQLAAFAQDHHVDLVTMTKGQASAFIDSLKKNLPRNARHTLAPSAMSPARKAQEQRASPIAHLPATSNSMRSGAWRTSMDSISTPKCSSDSALPSPN